MSKSLLFSSSASKALNQGSYSKSLELARYSVMFAHNQTELDTAYNTLSFVLFYLRAFRRCHDVCEQSLGSIQSPAIREKISERLQKTHSILSLLTKIAPDKNILFGAISETASTKDCPRFNISDEDIYSEELAVVGDSHVAAFFSHTNTHQLSPPLQGFEERIQDYLITSASNKVILSIAGNAHAKYIFQQGSLFDSDGRLCAYSQEIYNDFLTFVVFSFWRTFTPDICAMIHQRDIKIAILLPPPPLSNDDMQDYVNNLTESELSYFNNQNLKMDIAHQQSRLWTWHLLCAALRNVARHFGHDYIPIPSDALTDDGFLLPHLAKNLTHASTEYGNLVLKSLHTPL